MLFTSSCEPIQSPPPPAGGSDRLPRRRSVNIHPALSREESKHLPSAATLFGQRSPQAPRRKQRGRTHTSNNGTSSSHASGVGERPDSRLAEESPPSDLQPLSVQTSCWENREKRKKRRRMRRRKKKRKLIHPHPDSSPLPPPSPLPITFPPLPPTSPPPLPPPSPLSLLPLPALFFLPPSTITISTKSEACCRFSSESPVQSEASLVGLVVENPCRRKVHKVLPIVLLSN